MQKIKQGLFVLAQWADKLKWNNAKVYGMLFCINQNKTSCGSYLQGHWISMSLLAGPCESPKKHELTISCVRAMSQSEGEVLVIINVTISFHV